MRSMIPFMMTPVALLLATTASAQGSAQGCTPPAQPYFDFQVQQPAVFAGDTALAPRPSRTSRPVRDDPSALLVQFVVDTLGQPVARTFKVLKGPDEAAGESVRLVLDRWRYRPAMQGGCKVPQLVMTTVDR